MNHVLLTGFEAFGGDASNPSWKVASALDGERVHDAVVRAVRLPVHGDRAPAALGEALRARPAAVVMLGLAAGRPVVTVERVAVNVLDYRIPDNDGRVRSGEPVVPDGPAAYFSSLPLAAILDAWRSAGVPGAVSESAGAFLCNQVFYAARHELVTAGRAAVPAGFIHLPCDEELAWARPRPYVPLEHQVRAVRAALDAVVHAVATSA